MKYNNPSNKISLFLTFRNHSSLTISISNTLVLSFVLLCTFFFGFISQGDDNDNTALAFKPTVPSDQQQSQQQNQEQLTTSSKQISEEYVFLKKWGSQGNGPGQFEYPRGIPIDSSTGSVYVVDTGSEYIDTENHRIQKFDSNGNYIKQWGSKGNGTGQFTFPSDIAIDSIGNVYVTDDLYGADNTVYHPIQKFDSNGNFITKWGTNGTGDGQFDFPSGIAIDSSTGSVYVAENGNDRIQKFDSSGNYIKKWGSKGNGTGEFQDPQGVATDSKGNVYVLEWGNDRIQKFDKNGNYITKWGSRGWGNGQFGSPDGIAIDSIGNVYVADGNDRIQKFDKNGNYITKWGSSGDGDGQFSFPEGIAIDSIGNVYVVDTNNNRIQIFAPSSNVGSN